MLYEGSAVHQKFAALPAAYSGGICFAGMRENGQMRIYTDDSVQTSASFTLRERDRIDQLKPLLAEAEAKRELVRAAKEPPAWVVLEP